MQDPILNLKKRTCKAQQNMGNIHHRDISEPIDKLQKTYVMFEVDMCALMYTVPIQ